MKVLLDTCTFLWLAGGGRELPPRAAAVFKSQDNEVFLSAASAWEIAIKHAAGKLPLPISPQALIAEERDRLGVETLSIDEESALHVARLPPLHRDPIDRLLIAQALVHGLTLLTPDTLISHFRARVIW